MAKLNNEIFKWPIVFLLFAESARFINFKRKKREKKNYMHELYREKYSVEMNRKKNNFKMPTSDPQNCSN